MALSNIFNEPRREITESALGTIALVGILAVDYILSQGFYLLTGGPHGGCPVVLGMLVFVPLCMIWLIAIGLYFAHFLGEQICDFLAAMGLELRPKERRRG